MKYKKNKISRNTKRVKYYMSPILRDEIQIPIRMNQVM